nr:ATP-binding cassette domain-containing protein [Labrys wisconsinensis]
MLRLVHVAKRFGAVAAIDDVSLEVRRGEILGVIGRSGAGKSTLIRCLNGLEKPDSGRVEIQGRDIVPLGEGELRRVRGRIGMIFQHFNLLSAKTVADNVALPLKIAGWPRHQRRERVAALLQLVGLEAKASAYPAQLSGGQKQRVGIARALAADPALLLSDEATSALDPETTASILALLRDINRKLGLTIVLITHEMSVIRAIADRVVVLDHGRIAEEGDTAALFARPRTEITRRLLAPGEMPATGEAAESPGILPMGLAAAWAPGLDAVFRLTLAGGLAERPVLTDLAAATGAAPIILRAQASGVREAAATTILFAARDATPELIDRIERHLAAAGATVEILGYAQRSA